jgi:uncharacterized membrane protein YqjE
MTENSDQRRQNATRMGPSTAEAPPRAVEPSLAELVGELVNDAQDLARKEIQLAKAEVKEEVDKTLQAAVAIGAGAITVSLAAILLLFAVVNALVEIFSWSFWVSFSVVGATVLAIGLVALAIGRSRIAQVNPMPHETLESLRKDVTWIKNQTP